ncbi:hypothetical protein FK484_0077 [Listeria phage LP-031]|uniref:Uncharacterized protein n=1 Tax=Listeria phage LP-031 TaxID=2590049 RepID=A0A514U7G5_9CAUD|nr:hypothetical protein FK484_0077 [Listeria phage LP-031]
MCEYCCKEVNERKRDTNLMYPDKGLSYLDEEDCLAIFLGDFGDDIPHTLYVLVKHCPWCGRHLEGVNGNG